MRLMDIKARLAEVVTTEAQVKHVAAALGIAPGTVAIHPTRLDLTLADLARRLEGKVDLEARLDRALGRHVATKTEVAARLHAFLAFWYARCPGAKLPTPAELGAIIGATDKQVEALLAVGTEERA